MTVVNKITKIVAKILEIVHWVGAGLLVAVAICAGAAPQWLRTFMDTDAVKWDSEVSVYGLEVRLANTAGELDRTALLLFAIGGAILFVLVAMIFRNLYLIIKKSAGSTPFQKDNVRMLREIGIFSMAIPVVGLIMAILIRLIVGLDGSETVVSLNGFVTGIIVLSLTQVFAYGASLEKDVDGLL